MPILFQLQKISGDDSLCFLRYPRKVEKHKCLSPSIANVSGRVELSKIAIEDLKIDANGLQAVFVSCRQDAFARKGIINSSLICAQTLP